ncbi:VOC family protein [Streptomonospora arabica]|uniref:VOC family protein n=1 Tax=Streptomonospora arabica TaxID=412417 RepID=A0ABV9SKX1_9ACTN
MHEANGAATVWPVLLYRDAAKAIDWLVEAFGLTRNLVVPDDGGRIVHAELGWRGGVITLGGYDEDAAFSNLKPGGGAVYLVAADPDARFARATAAGAEVVRPLKDEDYGSRTFTVRDLEGNSWTFGTYGGAAPPQA